KPPTATASMTRRPTNHALATHWTGGPVGVWGASHDGTVGGVGRDVTGSSAPMAVVDPSAVTGGSGWVRARMVVSPAARASTPSTTNRVPGLPDGSEPKVSGVTMGGVTLGAPPHVPAVWSNLAADGRDPSHRGCSRSLRGHHFARHLCRRLPTRHLSAFARDRAGGVDRRVRRLRVLGRYPARRRHRGEPGLQPIHRVPGDPDRRDGP